MNETLVEDKVVDEKSFLAERMGRLGTETAFEVFAKATALEKQGRDIIHLELGEPDFITPKNILEAGKRALDQGWTKYGPPNGLPELRNAIADEVSKTRNIDVDPDGIVVTPGAKPIMFFAILALADEGDEVVFPDPGFPIFRSMTEFVNAKPVPIKLLEENDFSFDLETLRESVSDNTKLILLNTPHNPTGGMLSRNDLEEIAYLAKKHDCWVLSDEVYSRITYEHPFESIASIDGMQERTIILDGFSKSFAMTGWRMGYGVMPNDLALQFEKLHINSNSCTASFTQIAGIEALTGPQEDSAKMVEEFRKRRDVIVSGLNSIPGFRCLMPKGAFYAFPNIEGTGKTSEELESILLNKAGVAAISGLSFGKWGKGYLRFSYANSIENIEKAIYRIKDVVEKF
ncbi:pyridoxal phosphate-dependent aminotransferase, partial [candidate division KSB1 bacterium]|nr:pyridoxal phosphate-dependent aminotransferase [candidate division KSB1 bacterium]